MSLDALAEVVLYGKSTLSRVETVDAMIPPDLPAHLDAAFGTDGYFVRLYGVARHEVHPLQFRHRMELEARAVVVEEYACQLVPGLVQTKDYARAIFSAHDPHATEEEIDSLVALRMSRQKMLSSESSPLLYLMLDEAVLHRQVGGPKVMREQLAFLLERPKVTKCVLQVTPFSLGAHGLMGGSIALLTLDDGKQVANEEAITAGAIEADSQNVQDRRHGYNLLRACSLSPEKSAALIRSVMEGFPA